MVVDLDAFDANAADLVRRAGGTPIRVASKSVRVPALLSRVLARDGFHGVLAYTLAEALWLEEQGISDDIVVAYPTVDRGALDRLVASPSAAGADHADGRRRRAPRRGRLGAGLARGARSGSRSTSTPGCGWAASTSAPSARRSTTPPTWSRLAREIGSRPGFRLVGAMTYEGQVAGVQDEVPTQRARSAVVRRIKSLSLTQLEVRRREIADALRAGRGRARVLERRRLRLGRGDRRRPGGHRGGGRLRAAGADAVRPLPVASSRGRRRSSGCPVTRRPSPEIATVHGGGLVASGPAGADRLPTPWAPAGLHLTGLEGAGEVQTPLTGHPAALLEIGDLVWFRHAKSGEPFEHTNTVQLLSGARFVDEVPTYRGHGLAF